jgi:hypothetical protein
MKSFNQFDQYEESQYLDYRPFWLCLGGLVSFQSHQAKAKIYGTQLW